MSIHSLTHPPQYRYSRTKVRGDNSARVFGAPGDFGVPQGVPRGGPEDPMREFPWENRHSLLRVSDEVMASGFEICGSARVLPLTLTRFPDAPNRPLREGRVVRGAPGGFQKAKEQS